MKKDHRISTLDRILSRTLTYGVWTSAGVIFCGLAMSLPGHPPATPAGGGLQVVSAGIAMLIFLPAFRVMLMLGAFLSTREFRLAACAAIVLIVIALGFALGLRMAPAG